MPESLPAPRIPASLCLAVGAAVFVLAFLVRIANHGEAFVGGVPQVPPFDEIYHAKRIAYSAAHPFRVLSFDPNRGLHGAFCPWPPLYDMFSGLAARALGGRTTIAAVARAAWFPPIAASLVAAAIAAAMTRRFGIPTGLLAGSGVALSVYYLDKSKLGAIDHHFLEFPLVLGIFLAVTAVSRARNARSAIRSGGLLAVAVSLAVFVQPALVLAAGVALAAVLLLGPQERMARLGAGVGFALASALVFVYRAVQPVGYPDNEWYLGLPHAALLIGAAAACAAQLWMFEKRVSGARALFVAAVVGTLVIASIPTTLQSLTGGVQFFAGDPWLRSISEFQPLFFHEQEGNRLFDLGDLGGGALLAVPILLSRKWWTGTRRVLLLFMFVYLVASVSSMRFLAIAAPLLAVTGAVFYSDLRSAGSIRLAGAAAGLLLAFGLVLSLARALRPLQAIGPESLPIVRAVQTVAHQTSAPGAVLCSWSWGHLFNVVGGRRVMVDNFGSWSDRTAFEDAIGITFSSREKAVADYCAAYGVRFLVLENPLSYFGAHAETSGYPRSAFERPLRSGRPTRLMRASFWWRAYAEGGRSRPDLGPAGAPFRSFRLLRTEADLESAEKRSGVQVWEFRPGPTPAHEP